MTILEDAFSRCAFWILDDRCPPDTKYYLCKKQEDDCEGTCTLCWRSYLWGLASGAIEPPGIKRTVIGKAVR